MPKRRTTDTDSPPPRKAAKTFSKASAGSNGNTSSAIETKTDSNGDTYWDLSGKRRVTVSSFKGKSMVSVREYYEKDGEMLPGKKGISMSLEQYNGLVRLLPSIEAALKKKGDDVVRPMYKGAVKEESEEESADEDEDEESEDDGKGKKNIDATSDEESDEE